MAFSQTEDKRLLIIIWISIPKTLVAAWKTLFFNLLSLYIGLVFVAAETLEFAALGFLEMNNITDNKNVG